MAYKEKTCPKCNTLHNKRGPYCSRSCGNKRKHTKKHKEAVAESKREWHRTSEVAAVVAHNFTALRINAPDEPVPPIVPIPINNDQFIADGDLWTED